MLLTLLPHLYLLENKLDTNSKISPCFLPLLKVFIKAFQIQNMEMSSRHLHNSY